MKNFVCVVLTNVQQTPCALYVVLVLLRLSVSYSSLTIKLFGVGALW